MRSTDVNWQRTKALILVLIGLSWLPGPGPAVAATVPLVIPQTEETPKAPSTRPKKEKKARPHREEEEQPRQEEVSPAKPSHPTPKPPKPPVQTPAEITQPQVPPVASGLRGQSLVQEAALFSLADLGTVDFSRKTVPVEIFIGPGPEMDQCREILPGAWTRVQQFYARLGADLIRVPGRAEPGPLEPAKRLRVEVLPDKEWFDRSLKDFNVEPPFKPRFLQVCKDKISFSHLSLSVIRISFERFKRAELSRQPDAARMPGYLQDQTPRISQAGVGETCDLANVLIGQLGHLLGLYKANEFINDPVPEFQSPGETPNFMSNHTWSKNDLGFVEFQKRLIHSYLGRGKVFRQYEYVHFDPLRFVELIKRYNGFRN
jgi:hypothetical protein